MSSNDPAVESAESPVPATRSQSGLDAAVTPFRLPHYGPLWASNLLQFVCFHVLFMAMQWLVTSLTDLRGGVTFLSAIQGASIAVLSPFAGVVVDRYAKRNLILLGRLGLAGLATTKVWVAGLRTEANPPPTTAIPISSQ